MVMHEPGVRDPVKKHGAGRQMPLSLALEPRYSHKIFIFIKLPGWRKYVSWAAATSFPKLWPPAQGVFAIAGCRRRLFSVRQLFKCHNGGGAKSTAMQLTLESRFPSAAADSPMLELFTSSVLYRRWATAASQMELHVVNSC